MEIEEAFTAYLKSYSGLTALISDRIYPEELSQNATYPAVAYQFISQEQVESFHTPDTVLTGDTFQFTSWAATRKAADAVAKQIKKAFKNFNGIMGGAGGVQVEAITQVSKLKDKEDGKSLYRTMYEFEIWYQEV